MIPIFFIIGMGLGVSLLVFGGNLSKKQEKDCKNCRFSSYGGYSLVWSCKYHFRDKKSESNFINPYKINKNKDCPYFKNKTLWTVLDCQPQ